MSRNRRMRSEDQILHCHRVYLLMQPRSLLSPHQVPGAVLTGRFPHCRSFRLLLLLLWNRPLLLSLSLLQLLLSLLWNWIHIRLMRKPLQRLPLQVLLLFFIISISPQLFFFVTSRCHFQDLYILPFRRDLTFSNALLRYALTHVSEAVLIIHLYAGFVKLDFPVFTFSCYSTRALYARAL